MVDGGRYCDVRTSTEALAAPLGPEDQVVQSMPDCSPTKWHRAHTTWFFETFVLGPHVAGYEPVDERYAYLFNSYYEALGERQPRAARGLITRPTCDEVAVYRREVDAAMLRMFDAGVSPDVDFLVELGLHHEQQHQELLLMDAKHLLFQNPNRPAYATGDGAPHVVADDDDALGWIAHDGEVVEIGHDGDGFAFDNESPRHPVVLAPFALADRLVTCGEWLAFIDDGGYERADLWLSDGWHTVHAEEWRAPMYWSSDDDGGWSVFTLAGERAVDPAEPVVHVSYYEADAYARWAGRRLATEAEWEAIAATPAGAAARQLFTDVWQWTASPYVAYPGFRPASGAVGEYNGKFMVNQQILRGGCCATPAGHTRPTYRNFYGPHCRWPFTGVRLATDA